MTITAHGAYNLNIKAVWDNLTAIDLLTDSLKAALFTNTITPNFDTDTAYGVAPYNANEVGTPAGGIVITSPTLTIATGTLTFDAADTAWGAGLTFSGARGVLIYDDTIATPTADPAVCFLNFVTDFGVTNGVFTIQWAAGGIWSQDNTP